MSKRGGWSKTDTEPLRCELLHPRDARHWRAAVWRSMRKVSPKAARAAWRLAKKAGAYPVEDSQREIRQATEDF